MRRDRLREDVRDGVRTARVVGRHLLDMAIESLRSSGAPASTTSAAGLARAQATCRARLGELGVEVVVEHLERVPPADGLVFMWNQTSHLDHLALPLALPRPFFFLYNNAVRRTPVYGRYLARSGHLWLDRNDETQWRAQIARAADRVRAGECLLVSPEGTRSADGRLLPMKRGAFLLARLARRPIVCVTVIGAHALLPRGRAAVRPGTIRIVLEHPILVDDTTAPDLEQTVTRTFEASLGA